MKSIVPAICFCAVSALAGPPLPQNASKQDLTSHAWMLNAIVVRPPNAPNAASIKKHAERTHPPGGLFYQFAADGHYTSVRAAAGRQDGTWTIVAGKLSLTGAEKGAKPVICPLENLSADRLTFKLPMPAGAPDVVLDFAPGRMPQQ